MSRISAVLLDLDDTLVQYERSPGEVLRATFETLDIDPLFSVQEYYARYDEFAETADSMDELRSDCFAALAAENGHDRGLGRTVAETFSDQRDQTNVELLPHAERVLESLSRNYQLAVVTNGAEDAQRQKTDAVDLDRWVDTTVVAGHEVPPKPDPEPFERAMTSLDTTPETTIHVGDSLETDIAGASALGLDSVWVAGGADAEEYDPTYRVDSIRGVLSLPWVSGPSSGSQ